MFIPIARAKSISWAQVDLYLDYVNINMRQGNLNILPKLFCRATMIFILSLSRLTVATTETLWLKPNNCSQVTTTYKTRLFNINFTCMDVEMCLISILIGSDNFTKKCERISRQLPCINHDKLQTFNYLQSQKRKAWNSDKRVKTSVYVQNLRPIT